MTAIVGGSAAGKSWLAEELGRRLGENQAGRLSLDDFYRDLAAVPLAERERVNFDDPAAIDWDSFIAALRALRRGQTAEIPQYDFTTHTRMARGRHLEPRPVMLVEGLWLLRRRTLRALFDFAVFIECPSHTRWRRRLERDVRDRGRTEESVRTQFQTQVSPMHERFVAPQKKYGRMVVTSPVPSRQVALMVSTLRQLVKKLNPRAPLQRKTKS